MLSNNVKSESCALQYNMEYPKVLGSLFFYYILNDLPNCNLLSIA